MKTVILRDVVTKGASLNRGVEGISTDTGVGGGGTVLLHSPTEISSMGRMKAHQEKRISNWSVTDVPSSPFPLDEIPHWRSLQWTCTVST